MTVIDEFVLKFKNDAAATAADVKKLDDEISKLASKGQKRSDEETKQLKELRRLRTETTQDLKDQSKATDSLTDSLISLGVAGIAAFAGFEAIKKVSVDTQNFNLDLQRTRALTGQNAEEVEAWDQAFKNLGATQGSFKQSFINISQLLLSQGGDPKNIFPWFKSLSDELRALPENEARQRFSRVADANGLSPDLFQPLYSGKLKEAIEANEKLIKSNEETEQQALRLSAAWDKVYASITGLTTTIESRFISALTYIGDILSNLFSGNFSKAVEVWRHPEAYKPSSASTGSPSQVLPLISKYESDNRNVPNASGPGGTPLSTASGYYQITNGTWRDTAPKAGVSLSQYPTAISAPFDVQTKVASELYSQRGIDPWSSNTRLLAAIGQDSVSQADQSPLNSSAGGNSSKSVSIGGITVNTQATDANGIAGAISSALNTHIGAVISNWDDGVAK